MTTGEGHDTGAGNRLLGRAEPTPDAERLVAEDRREHGYVMNTTRLWAHLPSAHDALFALLGEATAVAGLTYRQRGVLVSASAGALGDPHCSLAWGTRLAGEAGADVAAGVLRGDDSGLTDQERALAAWARHLAAHPAVTGAEDVGALRTAGYEDRQIFAITLYVALRVAFSTVNDALGTVIDQELLDAAPPGVRAAATEGSPARR